MSLRRFALALVGAPAGSGAWAQDRVVCQRADATTQGLEAPSPVREPVDADPGEKITAVAQFEP
jgi:hypothetical protein